MFCKQAHLLFITSKQFKLMKCRCTYKLKSVCIKYENTFTWLEFSCNLNAEKRSNEKYLYQNKGTRLDVFFTYFLE